VAGVAPLRVVLSGARAAAARGYVGKRLVLGVRPQAIKMLPVGGTGDESKAGPVVEMRVSVVEPLGDQTDVVCATATNGHVVARVESGDAELKPGAVRRARLDPARLHLFKPGEFGKAV